jgi:hypothetical protein
MRHKPDRLSKIETVKLSKGAHKSLAEGACIMELISLVAGEPWSDHPQCACPVISAFLRTWNDDLPDDERETLLRPLIPRLVGTRGDADLERRRATMAADWLIRVHTPAWLQVAKLDAHADALASLPEITDSAQCPSLMPVLDAAQAAARAATLAAAEAATWDAVGAAVGAAAEAALSATRGELQQSALALVGRMIAAKPVHETA